MLLWQLSYSLRTRLQPPLMPHFFSATETASHASLLQRYRDRLSYELLYSQTGMILPQSVFVHDNQIKKHVTILTSFHQRHFVPLLSKQVALAAP
jgi:hypothetical protein